MHWHHRRYDHARDAYALLNVIRSRPEIVQSEAPTLAEMQELLQLPHTITPVSYTHLDVYKRQVYAIFEPCLTQKRFLPKP